LLAGVQAAVGHVVLVDDGMPPPAARELARFGAGSGATLLRLPANTGKGSAIATGLAHLLDGRPAPEAVLVFDADGQHPPEAIPALLAAAEEAELVIGNRFVEPDGMPWERRLMNRLASRLLSLVTHTPVPDSQCGMRLLRGSALHEVAFPAGRFEAETMHLKRCLREGIPVAWVPIPAIYPGHPSSFRSVRDSVRVLSALLR
jgi:glycosyltransferase involved in cell wall biosynthesis